MKGTFTTPNRANGRVVFAEAVIGEAERAIEGAWQAAQLKQPPPPLVDSPKCPGCSLVGICLPDETWSLQAPLEDTTAPRPSLPLELFEVLPLGSPMERNPDARLLVAARTDKRPLYLNTQGLRVGKTGSLLRINEKDTLVQEVRIADTCQVNLIGNIQIGTQALLFRYLCVWRRILLHFRARRRAAPLKLGDGALIRAYASWIAGRAEALSENVGHTSATRKSHKRK